MSKLAPSKVEMIPQMLTYCAMQGDAIVISFSILESQSQTRVDLQQDVVRKAVYYMQRRHALLRCHLQHDKSSGSSTLIFDDQSQIESDKVPIDWDRCESREQMIKCFEAKLSKPFGFDHLPYLWKVFVAEFEEEGKKVYSVAVWLPMMITDGMNCVTLNIELVNIINALLAGLECVEMKETLDHYGDVSNLIYERKLFNEKTQQNLDKYMEEMKKNGKKEEEHSFILPPEFQSNESGTRLSPIRMSPDKATNLMKNCKQHGERLTGVFTAVFFHSIKQLCEENNIKYDLSHVSVNMPISTRFRYTPILSTSHTGLNVICPEMSFDGLNFDKELKETVWENSKIINQQVDKYLDFNQIDWYISNFDPEDIGMLNEMLHQTFDLNDKETAEALCGVRSCDYTVSNIGRYVAESVKEFDSGPFMIRENYFGDSLSSSSFKIAGCNFYIGYWKGQMLALLSTNSSIMAEKYARRMSQLIEANLDSLTTF